MPIMRYQAMKIVEIFHGIPHYNYAGLRVHFAGIGIVKEIDSTWPVIYYVYAAEVFGWLKSVHDTFRRCSQNLLVKFSCIQMMVSSKIVETIKENFEGNVNYIITRWVN
jgi:hypothetical protein